jgi:transposase
MSSQPSITVGIDVGDRHSHLCVLDTQSGEVLEESRITTDRLAFERRFSGSEPMRVAVETGTHSPWISRVLEGCGHEVLVANARKLRLIYAEGRKNDRLDAENLARLARLDPRLLSPSPRSSTAGKPRRPTWR